MSGPRAARIPGALGDPEGEGTVTAAAIVAADTDPMAQAAVEEELPEEPAAVHTEAMEVLLQLGRTW